MGSEPPAEEWEQILGADLLPHLEPAGRRVAARQPLDVTVLPAGAHEPLADSIGRHRLEDLLILPGRTAGSGAAACTLRCAFSAWVTAPCSRLADLLSPELRRIGPG